MAKTILFDATGARHTCTYESFWDVALVHANDLINHLPEAGSDSPVVHVRAGGAKFDIRTAIEVFGCRVYAMFMHIKMLFAKMAKLMLPPKNVSG